MSISGNRIQQSAPLHHRVQHMLAGVLCDVGRIEVRSIERPEPVANEVLIRVAAVGLCGTDSHIFAGHANYNSDASGKPIPLAREHQILGHEISGVVVETGKDVADLVSGDRVVLDQGLNCVSRGRVPLCEYCQTGDSHQCEFYGEHGITGLPGGLAEFMAAPAVNAIKIRNELAHADAALVEPMGCIIHSLDVVGRARARFGLGMGAADRPVRSVLVCGAGPAGLLFIQYLRRIVGYDGQLLVSEPNQIKRGLAAKFGADKVFDPVVGNIAQNIFEETSGRGVEFLIEASGSGQVLSSAPGLIRKQATVLLYGHGHAGVELSVLNNLMFKEPVIVTPVGASGGFESDGRSSVYKRALNLIEQHRIDVSSIISHRYDSLNEVQNALMSDIHKSDYVKGVVELADTAS